MKKWHSRISDFGSAVWQNTDQISKWAQVVALCLAGFWTYRTFDLGEAPSLQTTVDVEGHLTVDTIDVDKNCRMDFHVTVENVGKIDFNVDRVWVRVWRGNLPSARKDGGLAHFDVDNLEKTQPIEDPTITGGNLIRHYSPHNMSGQTITWVLGPQKPGLILVRADAISKGKSLDYGREWMNNPCISSKTEH